ncbi:MAG: PQQ-binding-like beta-propeller repeat protein, partial [Actinomycetota bacterium]
PPHCAREVIRQARSILLLLLTLAATGAQTAHSQSEAEREPLSSLWRRKLNGVVAAVVSARGNRTLAVDAEGRLTCIGNQGETIWERAIPGVDRVATSRDGKFCAVYAARRPFLRDVSLLDDRGRTVCTVANSEPVSTAVISPDGHLAAVAAGHTVTLCSRTAKEVRERRIELQGTITQLQFGPGDSVYVAAQAPDYVALVKSTGKVLWRRNSEPGAAFAISASEDGRVLAIGSQRPDDLVALSLVSVGNQRLWSTPRPGRSPRVRIAADGSAVLLAYEHKVEHRMESRFEQRLAYFGTSNNESWTKGGAFNAPLCIALDRTGDWVVVLDLQRALDLPRFRLYGERGERRWMYTCDAPVLIASGSTEGRHIAVYRADGMLEMLHVAE